MKSPAIFSFAGAFVLSVSLFTSVYAQFNQVPDSIEYQALVDLYHSAQGVGWTNNTNWLNGTTSADYSTWRGVTVANGDVTELKLISNNLSGTIPESLGDLEKLKYLHLIDNNLTGSIPASLGYLESLNHLKLYGNQLTGEIPASLFQGRSIQQIMLGSNQLSGPIPEMEYAPIVEILTLDNNNLSGPIPASIKNFPNLSLLYLHHNTLTGSIPESIGELPKLDRLNLSYNKLTGSIPGSVGNLKRLQTLNLSYNTFSGKLPESLGEMSYLRWAYLNNCGLEGEIPESIGKLNRLWFLYLFKNKLVGNLPESIGNLKQLQRLYLNNNKISGPIPDSIGAMSNLIYLHLSFNQLTGKVPASIGKLDKLIHLFLQKNKLNGDIPQEAVEGNSLRTVNFQQNKFTSFPDFSTHPNRQSMNINAYENKLTFEGLETNFTAPGKHPFSSLSYHTQSPLPADTLAFAPDETVIIDTEDNAPHNRYQWQKLVNGSWSNIPETNESTYTITINESNSGSYRCRIANDWVTNLTIFSRTFVVQTTSEFWSVADGNWTTDRIWSTTKGGSPVTGYPQNGSKVYIVGNNVTLTDDITCGPLEVIVENREASLTVDGAEIIVHGEVKLKKATEGYPGNVKVVNGGKIMPVAVLK